MFRSPSVDEANPELYEFDAKNSSSASRSDCDQDDGEATSEAGKVVAVAVVAAYVC